MPRLVLIVDAALVAAATVLLALDAPVELLAIVFQLIFSVIVFGLAVIGGLIVARLRRSVRERAEELSRQARVDGLTAALNRTALGERAAVEFARAERERTPTSVIEVDVDHFKQLNDNFGHPLGDEVLQRVARALTEETRETDVVARVGGDEFAVLLPHTSAAEAQLVAERLRVAAEHDLEAGGTPVALSVGVATTPGPPALTFEQLWAAADAAMYEAKRSGRGEVRADGR